MNIQILKTIANHLDPLNELLNDSVASGASVGFLPPLTQQQVSSYWQSVEQSLDSNERLLLVAEEHGELLGAVQLSLCDKANGSHRAEVEKLMVHTRARGRGIAKQLMSALEQQAKLHHRSLLVLDTREGDTASFLYPKLGYTEVGRIPDFALSADGQLDGTIYFYKIL